MIIVSINGGLGNQLFQYAFGKHLAHLHHTEVHFDLSVFDNPKHRAFALHHFNTSLKQAKQNKLPFHIRKGYKNLRLIRALLNRFFYPYRVITQEQFDFNPSYLSINKNAYYWGYWQSEKYFSGVKDSIKQELSFKEDFSPLDESIRKKIEEQRCSVCLHIRRGDYVGHSLLPVCDLSYYKKAVDLITGKFQNPYFFIFSDDIAWCKENFKINHAHDFVNSGEDWRDLRLMTHCHHNIIANSSFGWWGAYLGQHRSKVVISPKHWFNENENSDNYNTKDLIPDNWIII